MQDYEEIQKMLDPNADLQNLLEHPFQEIEKILNQSTDEIIKELLNAPTFSIENE
ncbi:MAG: hypothetical protein PHE67_10155 [Campylobacterales bacterium]|nr:hypothetical protein [Campylobacterales bacterium]